MEKLVATLVHLSRRAQMVYLVQLLEQRLLRESLPMRFLPVLEVLWVYPTLDTVDDWHVVLVEIHPDELQEVLDGIGEPSSFSSIEQVLALRQVFLDSSLPMKYFVARFCRLSASIAKASLYGPIEEEDDLVQRKLLAILELVLLPGESPPDPSYLGQFHRNLVGGWGKPFDPSSYRRIGRESAE